MNINRKNYEALAQIAIRELSRNYKLIAAKRDAEVNWADYDEAQKKLKTITSRELK